MTQNCEGAYPSVQIHRLDISNATTKSVELSWLLILKHRSCPSCSLELQTSVVLYRLDFYRSFVSNLSGVTKYLEGKNSLKGKFSAEASVLNAEGFGYSDSLHAFRNSGLFFSSTTTVALSCFFFLKL